MDDELCYLETLLQKSKCFILGKLVGVDDFKLENDEKIKVEGIEHSLLPKCEVGTIWCFSIIPNVER